MNVEYIHSDYIQWSTDHDWWMIIKDNEGKGAITAFDPLGSAKSYGVHKRFAVKLFSVKSKEEEDLLDDFLPGMGYGKVTKLAIYNWSDCALIGYYWEKKVPRTRVVKRLCKTYLERLYCICGKELQSDGEAFMTNPPKYVHWCSSCWRKEIVQGKRYPRTVIEEVDDENP